MLILNISVVAFSQSVNGDSIGSHTQPSNLKELTHDVFKAEYHQYGAEKFYFEKYNSKAEIEELTISEYSALLNVDVIKYYNLKEYNTELKKQVFKESEEYKILSQLLWQEQNEVKYQNYYFLYNFRNNVENDMYNVTQKAFYLIHSVIDINYTPVQGCINFSGLCLSYPENHTKTTPKDYGNRGYYYHQVIKIPIADAAIALKIEENMNDCALLFIFKMDKAIKRKTGIFTNDFIIGKTQSAYVVNTKTGEIYSQLRLPN